MIDKESNIISFRLGYDDIEALKALAEDGEGKNQVAARLIKNILGSGIATNQESFIDTVNTIVNKKVNTLESKINQLENRLKNLDNTDCDRQSEKDKYNYFSRSELADYLNNNLDIKNLFGRQVKAQDITDALKPTSATPKLKEIFEKFGIVKVDKSDIPEGFSKNHCYRVDRDKS